MEWVILGLLIVSLFIPSDESSETITVCVLSTCKHSTLSTGHEHTESEEQQDCEPE